MGHTYVMSDLHGMYGEYLRMLDKIKFGPEDILYVLGDVIDRGPDGIALLQDFMKRDNVTLLLGNHEDMMLEVVELTSLSLNEGGGCEEKECRRSIFQWYQNGGKVTAYQFFQMLNYKEQARLIAYLENCPLMLPNVEVKGKRYYLVHACPDLEGIADAITDPVITRNSLCELSAKEAEKLRQVLLWDRPKGTEEILEHCCVIFGHTPTDYYQNDMPMRFWRGNKMINIDSGCSYLACKEKGGRMGCLRLEDEAEFYL